jgi:hypothetical protein
LPSLPPSVSQHEGWLQIVRSSASTTATTTPVGLWVDALLRDRKLRASDESELGIAVGSGEGFRWIPSSSAPAAQTGGGPLTSVALPLTSVALPLAGGDAAVGVGGIVAVASPESAAAVAAQTAMAAAMLRAHFSICFPVWPPTVSGPTRQLLQRPLPPPLAARWCHR